MKKELLGFGIVLVFVVLIAIIIACYTSNFENFDGQEMEIAEEVVPVEKTVVEEEITQEPLSMDEEDQQKQMFKQAGVDRPTELLPADTDADGWAMNVDDELSPEYKSFIDAGQHVGADSRGGILKNPNLQIRSDPPIPKEQVGPWNNSTILRNPYERQFEVGSAI